MTPNEILAGPFTMYLAAVGTAFPTVITAPPVAWTKIGTGGDRNYTEDGVTVMHSQQISQARVAGALGPVKAWRTGEDLKIKLELLDMTLEQYSYLLNGNIITTTAAGAGTAGTKRAGLSRAADPATYALLLRGLSPYGDAFTAQFEVPRCYQSADASPVFRKGQPAALSLEFTALEDSGAATPAERFGRFVGQHQAAI